MPATTGQLLGAYRLGDKIGEGGMGEVWRASDTRLDREVAVKILPDAVARDPDRRARFEREAKAVAALSHPNILAVHDFGRDDDTAWLVMELLEGTTLRGRLADGPLPARKAAELGRQIARGLAAAHERGIVHRDLKPENVFVTRDGRAKILDFGLAGSPPPLPGSSAQGATHTPTATGLTAPGVVMGTADYMSPEQVRGEQVDHRSDVFSFGALLYETITGRRPFHRDTAAETMTAILREDPPDPASTDVQVPQALDRVVRRCLEKRPEERFQSASDLAFAVENALGTTTSGLERAVAGDDAPARRSWPLLAVLAAIALVAGGVAIGKFMSPRPRTEPNFTQVSFREGSISSARFAGDGDSIVYAADWNAEGSRLFVTQASGPGAREFGLDDAEILSVSPSGELAVLLDPRPVVGWSRRGTLARIPFGGGAPREMLADVQDADWHPHEDRVAAVRFVDGTFRLEYPPQTVLYVSSGWLDEPRFSPDGTRIAFAIHPDAGDDRGFVAVTDLAGDVQELTPIFSSLRGLAWSPDGSEIWFTAGERGTIRALHAIDLKGRMRVVTRAPADLRLHDVGPDGRVLLARNTGTRGMAGRAPGADEEVSLSWLDWGFPAGLAADGEQVLFTEQGEGGGPEYSVYLRAVRGGPPVRIGEGNALALSPDGRSVLAREQGASTLLLYPTGAGAVRRIPLDGIRPIDGTWVGEDRIHLWASNADGTTGWYEVDLASGSARALPGLETGSWRGVASHDGRFVALRPAEGPLVIWSVERADAVPLPGAREDEIVAGWSADSTAVLLADTADLDAGLVITRVDVATGRREELWRLLADPPAGLLGVFPVLVTPDGRGYVYSYRRLLSTLYVAEGL